MRCSSGTDYIQTRPRTTTGGHDKEPPCSRPEALNKDPMLLPFTDNGDISIGIKYTRLDV